jgi:hypothetical protein
LRECRKGDRQERGDGDALQHDSSGEWTCGSPGRMLHVSRTRKPMVRLFYSHSPRRPRTSSASDPRRVMRGGAGRIGGARVALSRTRFRS